MPGPEHAAMMDVNGLHKNFRGIAAVQNVSFNVNQGEVVSLIGPNGAGKTTCFNLITGFYKPDSGSVFFDGNDVTGLEPSVMAALGVVRTFQKTNIFKNLTVFENVLTARHRLGVRSLWRNLLPGRLVHESERRMRDDAAEIVDLIGLSARMNTVSSSLSCGELRLLEVATALGAGPRLLMLDEPAAGLNTEEALILGKALRGLVRTRIEALLLVEHNMSLVMALSDRVVVMNFGQKLTEGRPEEVRENPAVVEAYLGKSAA
jgi:branched-chain amino acid transport system ATP-binding protein